MKPIDSAKLKEALQLLNEQLELHGHPRTELVVCGGSALIAMGLVQRTTQDIDVVALMENGRLAVHYIDRTDQIHFKVFAAVDRGGYHISDLKALHPADDELYRAALWSMEQDVSEGFRYLLREMFNQNGWENVGARI